MPKYQGHENWNQWNVSLWIANEEPIYRFAKECLQGRSLKRAVCRFLEVYRNAETPDGGRYSYAAVYAALKGLRD